MEADISCSECGMHFPRGIDKCHELDCPVMLEPKKWGIDIRDWEQKYGHWEHRTDYGPWDATPQHVKNMKGVVRFYLKTQKNYRRIFEEMRLTIGGREVYAYRDQFLNWDPLPKPTIQFHDAETCVPASEFPRDSGYAFWMPHIADYLDTSADVDVILPQANVEAV